MQNKVNLDRESILFFTNAAKCIVKVHDETF